MKFIYLTIQIIITIFAVIGCLVNFPYSTKVDISQQKHIVKLNKYIVIVNREEQRFPSRNEIIQWMERQDSKGMHYDGKGFEVRQTNKSKYSISFIESDAWVTYYSTKKKMEFARVSYSKSDFYSFIVLLIVSFLSFAIYLKPVKKTEMSVSPISTMAKKNG